MEQNRILVSIKTYSNNTLNILKDVANQLVKEFKVTEVSSVYRVINEDVEQALINIHDLRGVNRFEGLTMVLKAQTSLSPEKCLDFLLKVESLQEEKITQRAVSLNLLTYEDHTVMTPQLTLPYPEFHLRPEELVPAAEVWGDYKHPVLKKSIYSLTKEVSHKGWGEFFAQGKSLLDF